VNCDELTLDASHSGIRRDGAYQLLLGALTAQARTAAN
jgi:hypothetical protein